VAASIGLALLSAGAAVHAEAIRHPLDPLTSAEIERAVAVIKTARWWMVVNEAETTTLGHHPGFALEPGKNSFSLAGPDSPARRKMPFINHHLWVTPFRPEEMYPAGVCLGADQIGKGLPEWTAANRGVRKTDVVLWYTLGVTHLPHPEDWSIKPSRRAGFKLVPFGFFTANPSMDVTAPNPW
jgi:primary-amine oxidase